MKNLWNVAVYTMREAIMKKVFLAFAILSTVGLLCFFGVVKLSPMPDSATQAGMMQQTSVWAPFLGLISSLIMPVGLTLSIFGVSFLTSRILDKGTVEIFLALPFSRSTLLFGRFLGATLVVLINITYLVLGYWLITGACYHKWTLTVLVIIPLTIFAFIALYAIILFLTVVFRSQIIGVIFAFITLILSFILFAVKPVVDALGSTTAKAITGTLYYIVPQIFDLTG
jgi:ABC-type transport system involved in multi-copper enzyme maturation permease subunit